MLDEILPKDYLAALSERFELIKILGYGGMGLCYLARDLSTQQDRALKILHPDLHQSRDALLQLKREAAFEQKFSAHPHIVQTLELLELEKLTVKVMEVMSGITLKEYLQKPLFDRQELYSRVLATITNALATIHQAGIIHCDVKPANIFINLDGSIRLFDFGIARAAQDNTPLNFSAFSPRYTSPRVMEGQIPTPDDDFYSLNVVAEEILNNVSH